MLALFYILLYVTLYTKMLTSVNRSVNNFLGGASVGRKVIKLKPDLQNIYAAEPQKNYVVQSVPKANLLPCLGIFPKSIVTKNYRYRLGGPVLLKVGNRQVAIGKDLAKNILVKEAP